MHHDTQVRLARTLLDHIDRAEPLRAEALSFAPAHHYTSTEHLARETDTVLRQLPQLVALSADLPDPGSYVVRDLVGGSVVVARDGDGAVHASANACRHRGARVVEGRGTARRLTCPYHSWSYHSDGTLAGLPDATSFDGLDLARCRLPQVPVAEVAGTIWIVPGDGALATDEMRSALGPFADDFDAVGVADHVHWRGMRAEVDLNWKLVIDTFLEPYHLASLHRESVAKYFVPNLCTADRHGDHVREVLARRDIDELRDLPEDDWDLITRSTVVYSMFPTTVLVVQIDRIETWRVQPVAGQPGRCVCELDFYVPADRIDDESQRYWERNWQLTVDTVFGEDFVAMAGVQANLEHGALDHLTFGRNEPALAMFHERLAHHTGASLTSQP